MFQHYILNNSEQSFYFFIDATLVNCRLYEFGNLLYIDVKINQDEVLFGQRVIQNKWILPNYLGMIYGNFRFETLKSDSESYPTAEGLNEMFKLNVYMPDEYSDIVKTE